jgi:RNA polymerase sigma factor (sigma-70 family)
MLALDIGVRSPVVAPMSAKFTSPSLSPLFADLARGDPDAINAILTRCQKRLKALTRRALRGFPAVRQWDDTSAVYAEASLRFLAALRELSFANPADFLCLAAWQIRMTLIDLTRRKQFVGCPGGLVGNYDPAGDSTNDPQKLLMWGEFHAVVSALPEQERKLFDLLFYQDLSLNDASQLLGVPRSTLKLRWQNARANLMLRFRNQLPV